MPTSPATGTNGPRVATVAQIFSGWSQNGSGNPFAVVNDNVYLGQAIGPATNSGVANARTFGFAIPAGSTITGIELKLTRAASISNNIVDNTVQLARAGTTISGVNNKANTTTRYAVPPGVTLTYGGSTDTWGVALTDVDVNNANFGVIFIARNIGTQLCIARLDFASMSLWYSYTLTTQSKARMLLAKVTEPFAKRLSDWLLRPRVRHGMATSRLQPV